MDGIVMWHGRCVCIWWQCVPAQRSPGAGVCSAAPLAVRCAPRGPLELGRLCRAPASPLDSLGRAHHKRRRDGRHLVVGFHSETTVLLTCTPFHSPNPTRPNLQLLPFSSVLRHFWTPLLQRPALPGLFYAPPLLFFFHDSHENGTQETIDGTQHTTTDPDFSWGFFFGFVLFLKEECRKKDAGVGFLCAQVLFEHVVLLEKTSGKQLHPLSLPLHSPPLLLPFVCVCFFFFSHLCSLAVRALHSSSAPHSGRFDCSDKCKYSMRTE